MPELVLYGIRELAKQLLGTVLDIEVDHSGQGSCGRAGIYWAHCRNNLSVLTEDEMAGGTMRNNRRTKRTESFV